MVSDPHTKLVNYNGKIYREVAAYAQSAQSAIAAKMAMQLMHNLPLQRRWRYSWESSTFIDNEQEHFQAATGAGRRSSIDSDKNK
jgi:hypothetical protein